MSRLKLLCFSNVRLEKRVWLNNLMLMVVYIYMNNVMALGSVPNNFFNVSLAERILCTLCKIRKT